MGLIPLVPRRTRCSVLSVRFSFENGGQYADPYHDTVRHGVLSLVGLRTTVVLAKDQAAEFLTVDFSLMGLLPVCLRLLQFIIVLPVLLVWIMTQCRFDLLPFSLQGFCDYGC